MVTVTSYRLGDSVMPGTISPYLTFCLSRTDQQRYVLHMTDFRIPVPDHSRPPEPGEALKECMQAIRRAHPDYESAQVYAILSLNEALQNIAAQLAELNKSMRRPDQ